MTFVLPELLPYQQVVTDFIVEHPRCGIWVGMGGGKTLGTLTALARVRPNDHILVIAPVNIARSTWIEEIEKWGFPLRARSLIVNDNDKKLSKAKRLERYAEILTDEPTMYFINIELFEDLVKNMPVKRVNGRQQIQWPFPTIIIDESQTVKNPQSVRFKAAKRVEPALVRLIELTGTPAPNGLLDIWSQVFLLDGGQALGRTFSEYRTKYFVVTKYANNQPVEWELRPGAEKEIYARIGHLVMSTENTAIPKPPVSIDNVSIVLPKDVIKAYRRFEREQVLELASPHPLDPSKLVITADSRAILHGKLLQYASGTIYTDEDHNIAVIHNEKLEMADYIIRNSGGSPVLIANRFRSDKDRLLKHLAPHGIQAFDGSRGMVQRWNAGQVPVMLIHPASAGHGLNLQDGGHDLIWYTLPDSLEQYEQTNARLARMGQSNPVQISQLIAKGTRDERQPRVLAQKAAMQKGLIDAVRVDFYDPDDDLNEILGDLDIGLW